MRSVTLICGMFAITMMLTITPQKSLAQQEIESDSGEIVINATINAIDVENQLLTVTGPQGNTIVVKATPEMLGRVKLKEQITMNTPTVAEQTWVEAAPQGETELNTVEVTATVANVDYVRRIVTFNGPNGTLRKIRNCSKRARFGHY